jgi:hypothetical protein
MTGIRFYIDPETLFPHIHNHGVEEHEVSDVLGNPGEDRAGREGSRIAIGQTNAGRSLQVVYVLDRDSGGIFVITAYELSSTTLAAYRRRMRRRQRG